MGDINIGVKNFLASPPFRNKRVLSTLRYLFIGKTLIDHKFPTAAMRADLECSRALQTASPLSGEHTAIDSLI